MNFIHKRAAEATCERVDDEADHHGDDGDEDPVGKTLVLHAAVDGDGGLVALAGNRHRRGGAKRM